jgi:heme/copper-type cytochrome/quinol oxidase subunit 2
MIRSKKMIVVSVVILLVVSLIVIAIGGIFNLTSQASNAPPSIVITKSTCDRPPGFILIIADLSGFNDSIGHGAPLHPWPVIRIQRGQMVRFVVCNHDTTQPHGFAIRYYLDAGIAMAPGDAYQIVFPATETGTFDIFCNIFCTIHVFMRGQLIVSG